MKLLITNYWLKKLGGSETFTYTLAEELHRRKIKFDLFTLQHGIVSIRIQKEFGASRKLLPRYDLVFANHNVCVDKIKPKGRKIIQTCHGIYPKLEQPSPNADKYVAISEEVKNHIGGEAKIILNGINLERFRPLKLNSKPKNILSLVHSDKANEIIEKACEELNINFWQINKYKRQVWNMEDHIRQADMVISLGRGAYEAFACGKPTIIFDARPYQESYADGYMTEDTLPEAIKNNCSGRRFKLTFDHKDLANEIKKYNPKDGEFLRAFAEENLDVRKQVDKYFEI